MAFARNNNPFLIGPKKLPKMAQTIGRSINELKRVIDAITTGTFTEESTDKIHAIKQIPESSIISAQTGESKPSSSENHKRTPHI